MKSDSISQENDDNILKKINQSISQLMLLEIELEKKNDSLETQLNSELGVKTRKDMELRDLQRHSDLYSASLYRAMRKGITSINDFVNDKEETTIQSTSMDQCSEVLKNMFCRVSKAKLSMIISHGKYKHRITVRYEVGVFDRIKHLKMSIIDEIGMYPSGLLRDKYGNILLENLNILESIFPFYNFFIRGVPPEIEVVYPYGVDKAGFFKDNKKLRLMFEEESTSMISDYNLKKTKIISENTNDQGISTVEARRMFKRARLKQRIFKHSRKIAKIILMVTIILCYYAVFGKRQNVLEKYQFLNAVEDIEDNVVKDRMKSSNLSFPFFVESYFAALNTSDVFKEKKKFNRMAVFQVRFTQHECKTYNNITSSFLKNNSDKITCYDPNSNSIDPYLFGVDDEFTYSVYPKYPFRIGGRPFSIGSGYYRFLETNNLTNAKENIQQISSQGWFDKNTKYVGIILNLYDPIFSLIMQFTIFYDFRFGFTELSSIKSFGFLTNYHAYSKFEIGLIIYMGVGCIASVFLVIYESFKLFRGKFHRGRIYDELETEFPELVGYVEKKAYIFNLSTRSALIFIKPNLFQLSTFFNFIVLLGVLIVRVKYTLRLTRIDFLSEEYVNLIEIFQELLFLSVVDGINTFFIFFSLFYYTAQAYSPLFKIAIFFIKIAKTIFNLIILLFCIMVVFGLCFFAFFQQYDENLNDFSSMLISMYSLSFGNYSFNSGNSILNEYDNTISTLGEIFYYMMLILEYIAVYLVGLIIIYAILGREFIRPKTERRFNSKQKIAEQDEELSDDESDNKTATQERKVSFSHSVMME